MAPRLAEQGTWITWGTLPEQAAGVFNPSLNRITVNGSQSNESPGVLATTISHEALHAVYPHGTTTASCIREEANAFAIEVQTWVNLPAALRQSTSQMAQFEQRIATVYQQQGVQGISNLVASNPAYQQECA